MQNTKCEFNLSLYVSGTTSRSLHAISSVKAICDQHLSGRHQLEIIDIYQLPEKIKDENILAVPVLVINEPLPKRYVTGDFTDYQRLLDILTVEPQ